MTLPVWIIVLHILCMLTFYLFVITIIKLYLRIGSIPDKGSPHLVRKIAQKIFRTK